MNVLKMSVSTTPPVLMGSTNTPVTVFQDLVGTSVKLTSMNVMQGWSHYSVNLVNYY